MYWLSIGYVCRIIWMMLHYVQCAVMESVYLPGFEQVSSYALSYMHSYDIVVKRQILTQDEKCL